MPVTMLFELDDKDLDAVMADSEVIARTNPQAGDMRQIDHIAWHDEGYEHCVAVKQVREDEFWVPGHIPGRPLMPGVLMIEAGAQAACFLHRRQHPDLGFLGFTRCDDCVFRGTVVPGDTLYILVEEEKANMRRFISKVQGVVDGRLVFEARITGMTLPE